MLGDDLDRLMLEDHAELCQAEILGETYAELTRTGLPADEARAAIEEAFSGLAAPGEIERALSL